MFKFVLFYTVGAIIIGLFVSTMKNVESDFKGQPLRYPRLFAGILSGVLWPVFLAGLMFGRNKKC